MNLNLTGWHRGNGAIADHAIDHSVFESGFGLKDIVAIDIAGNSVNRLAGGIGQDFVQRLAHAQDFPRIDVDIGGLPAQTAHGGLVDQDAGMRQAEALALGSAGEQNRRHGSSLAQAIGDDVGLDQAHGVENRQTRRDRAAGRIDVERDIAFRIFRGQK